VIVVLILFGLVFASVTSNSAQDDYPDRWVFFHSYTMDTPETLQKAKDVVRTASEYGLTGIVLEAGFDGAMTLNSGGFDSYSLAPPAFIENVKALNEYCRTVNIELVPALMQVGRGGGILAHDENLAEGFFVEEATLEVEAGRARLILDADVALKNGDLEEWQGDRLLHFSLQDGPGRSTFADREVVKHGRTSLRMENFRAGQPLGFCRIAQEIFVKPRRQYRIRLWVRNAGFRPRHALQVLVTGVGETKQTLAQTTLPVGNTDNWQTVNAVFNSGDYRRVNLALGVWGGMSGTLWLDGISVQETAFVNVLRRPGTPLKIIHEPTGMQLEEDKDFEPLSDPRLDIRATYHEPPVLRLLPGSQAGEGDRLRASFYHPLMVSTQSVAVCMSEPKVFEIWRQQIELLHKHLAPRKYFLMMDEIREAGSCYACRSRELSLAEILGDCITRQFQLIRKINPRAEVYVWADMLDPYHNCRDNYYLCHGDFTGASRFVPKDVIMVPWHWGFYEKNFKFFSDQGFRILAWTNMGDPPAFERVQYALKAFQTTPGAQGVVYCTWQGRYDKVGEFGDLMAGKKGKVTQEDENH